MVEPIIVDGCEYYTAADVAARWDIKEKTVKGYATPKCNKLRGCIRRDGVLLVPANAIIPLGPAKSQGALWLLVHFRIGYSNYVDLSGLNMSNNLMKEVLLDLRRQNLINFDSDDLDVRTTLNNFRMTDKGFKLIEYRSKFIKNPVKDDLTSQDVALVLSGIQTVAQLIQFGMQVM